MLLLVAEELVDLMLVLVVVQEHIEQVLHQSGHIQYQHLSRLVLVV